MPEALNLRPLPVTTSDPSPDGEPPHAPLPHAAVAPIPSAAAAAAAATSLVTLETSSQKQPIAPSGIEERRSCPCSADQEFRHSGWTRQRQATWEAFQRMHLSRNRVEAFEECGAHCSVFASLIGEETYVVRGSNCHDRFCIPCSVARSFAVAHKIAARIGDARPLFLTFTLRARADEPLRDNLDRLLKSFAQLRRLALWTDSVDGGAAVTEVKRGKQGQWHTHIHVLAVGRYIDQKRLADAWRAITGDSYIVDVQRAHNTGETAAYINKAASYAAKPMEAGFWKVPALLEEAILALRGRRMIIQFGTWYNSGTDLDEVEELWTPYTHPHDFVRLGSLSHIYTQAMAGNAAAHRVLHLLRTRDPLDGSRLSIPPPQQCGGERDRIRCDATIKALAPLADADTTPPTPASHNCA